VVFTAIVIIAATVLGESSADKASEPTTSQGANRELLMSVSVTDEKGRIAAKLSKDRFTVLDGKTPLEISSFEEKDAPYSVGFLIDTSGSMLQARKLLFTAVQDNILSLITRSHEANEYFMLAFGPQPQLLMDWTRDMNRAVETLKSLALAKAQGATAFYDACYFAIEKLNQRSNPRRVLILITDALDNSSRHSYRELREFLKQSNIIVYAIFTADPVVDSLAGYGREVIEQVTSISGGERFVPDSNAKINEAFALIGQDMRHQYLIGFNPAAFDGKWHSIKIKVKPIEVPDPSGPGKAPKQIKLFAHTRQGFYVPKALAK
jgi:VWFA-related protein